MKKTLQKLAFTALAVGSMTAFSTMALAQGGQKPTYDHAPTEGKTFFIKGAHSSISQGVATDRAGRVWTISNGLGFYVVNPDGSEYRLTSGDLSYSTPASNSGITQDYVSAIFTTGAGVNESLTNAGRGIALAHDGNILVAQSNALYKLNSITGAPMARWSAPTVIASPSSDAQGNIFISGVVDNKQYIIKHKEGTETFETVMPETAFSGRAATTGAVVRNAAISQDGKTIYLPYANKNEIERYTSPDMITWTKQDDIANDAPSNAIFTGKNNMTWFITFGSADARPILHFRDENKLANNWTEELTDVMASDIRGLAFTKGYDTLYLASGNLNGNIHRYITQDEIILSVRKDALAKLVTAFPVPTTGQVTIEMPASLQRSAKVQVTDLSGKNVSVRQSVVSNGSSLDLSGLAAGTYLVIVDTNDGKIVRRVIKQ